MLNFDDAADQSERRRQRATSAGVTDANAHTFGDHCVGLDLQIVLLDTIITHCLDPVDEQVQHHLLELKAISLNRRQRLRQLCACC